MSRGRRWSRFWRLNGTFRCIAAVVANWGELIRNIMRFDFLAHDVGYLIIKSFKLIDRFWRAGLWFCWWYRQISFVCLASEKIRHTCEHTSRRYEHRCVRVYAKCVFCVRVALLDSSWQLDNPDQDPDYFWSLLAYVFYTLMHTTITQTTKISYMARKCHKIL